MKSAKDEIEDWLTIIDKHLGGAERAFKADDSELAEAEVFAARDKLRHATLSGAENLRLIRYRVFKLCTSNQIPSQAAV